MWRPQRSDAEMQSKTTALHIIIVNLIFILSSLDLLSKTMQKKNTQGNYILYTWSLKRQTQDYTHIYDVMIHFLVGNLSRNIHLLANVQGFSDKKKNLKLKLSQTTLLELMYPSTWTPAPDAAAPRWAVAAVWSGPLLTQTWIHIELSLLHTNIPSPLRLREQPERTEGIKDLIIACYFLLSFCCFAHVRGRSLLLVFSKLWPTLKLGDKAV